MATDSAELTFVRCRSCGALVPATATKCRICNAALDAAGKLEESGEGRSGSRVRQRTMSSPSGDVMEAVQKLRDEEPVPGDIESEGASAGAAASAVDDDPLGAYLEEVDDVPASGGSDLGGSSGKGDDDEDDFPSALGDDPIFGDPGLDDDDDDFISPFAPPPQQEASKPRESAFGGGGNRGFQAPPSEPSGGKKSPFTRPGDESKRRDTQGQGQQREKSFDRGGRDKNDRGGNQSQRESRERGNRGNQNPPQGRPQAAAPAATQTYSGPVQETKRRPGKLGGWLVSYADADGAGIELREGKFFVTGSPFKGSDLVVEDSSVSTPHCLLSVSTDGGIRVQDLMSDAGLFTKTKGASEYQKNEGPVNLSHGDWVKFGNVEFLVCTVAKGDS